MKEVEVLHSMRFWRPTLCLFGFLLGNSQRGNAGHSHRSDYLRPLLYNKGVPPPYPLARLRAGAGLEKIDAAPGIGI